MCSGRVDLEFILRAFANGQDGVLIGGCRLNECNYVTQGNYDALGNVLLCRKILGHLGVNPERLQINFMSAGDGILLAGHTLYAVRNQDHVAIIDLAPGLASGTIVDELSGDFDVPTTVARHGSSLYVVNAAFRPPGAPPATQFWVRRIDR